MQNAKYKIQNTKDKSKLKIPSRESLPRFIGGQGMGLIGLKTII